VGLDYLHFRVLMSVILGSDCRRLCTHCLYRVLFDFW